MDSASRDVTATTSDSTLVVRAVLDILITINRDGLDWRRSRRAG